MTNEHERGVEAAAQKLLARGEFSIHEGANRSLAHIAAEEAIAAYIEAGGFDSVPALLSRIAELERERDDHKADYFRRHNDAVDHLERALVAEVKLAEAVKMLRPFAQIADMEEQAGAIDSVIVNVARCRDARSFLQSLSAIIPEKKVPQS